jgi:hypothetical protein
MATQRSAGRATIVRRTPPSIRKWTTPSAGSSVCRRSTSIVPRPLRYVTSDVARNAVGAKEAFATWGESRIPLPATATEGTISAAIGSSAQAGPSRGHATSTREESRGREHGDDPAEAEERRRRAENGEHRDPDARGGRLRQHHDPAGGRVSRLLVLVGDDQPAGEIGEDPQPADQRRRQKDDPDQADGDAALTREAGAHATEPLPVVAARQRPRWGLGHGRDCLRCRGSAPVVIARRRLRDYPDPCRNQLLRRR